MTPVLLILSAPPRPGQTYNLAPIIGDTRPRTVVCRGLKRRVRTVGYSVRDADGRLVSPAEIYEDEIWEFLDTETGEIILREVEIHAANRRDAVGVGV